jgi:hypothetical protein
MKPSRGLGGVPPEPILLPAESFRIYFVSL